MGSGAALAVGIVACPVPRPDTISLARALFLSILYVLGTALTGAGALAVSSRTLTSTRRRCQLGRMLLPFCTAVAWLAPVLAFSVRGSFWAGALAAAPAALGAGVLHHWRLATRAPDAPEDYNPDTMGGVRSRTTGPMIFAAALFHAAWVFAAADSPRLTGTLIGAAYSWSAGFIEVQSRPMGRQRSHGPWIGLGGNYGRR